MAITDTAPAVLDIIKTSLAGQRSMTTGLATLSSGTVNLVTGLKSVDFVFCMCLGVTDTETLSWRMSEATVPTTSGTVRIDAGLNNEGSSTANAGAEQFAWFAIGRK